MDCTNVVLVRVHVQNYSIVTGRDFKLSVEKKILVISQISPMIHFRVFQFSKTCETCPIRRWLLHPRSMVANPCPTDRRTVSAVKRGALQSKSTTVIFSLTMSFRKALQLNNGKNIPQIGLGTWLSKPHEVENSVCQYICAYIHPAEFPAASYRWCGQWKVDTDTSIAHISTRIKMRYEPLTLPDH